MRIVIKIGTSSLTYATGRLNYRYVKVLVGVLCDLKNMGHEVVLVSSGAMGVGLGKTTLAKKPAETDYRRALAAIGQSSLMAIYEELFGAYGCQVSQVLITKSALQDEANKNDIASAFSRMFELEIIPIVNENDVVASDAMKSMDLFGDNDTLSAHVAEFIKADLLIILSDINGLYDSDPRGNPNAKIIPLVTHLNDEIYKMASGAGTARGTGGMATKLNAAAIVMASGKDMVITNSSRPDDLYKIVAGEAVGTLFKGRA
ncbi:MAG: glutamate 5-kinase [Defluviitaleaceae bacterium]|nr:glutamate 5-kinase [Defluviitaleaceae bacterium]